MPAVLFQARLVDKHGHPSAELTKILFGVNSVEEKEHSFRDLCKQKYPQLLIKEPIRMAPAKGA